MTPRIKTIRVSIRSVPMPSPWQISLYSATERAHAIVEVITDSGIVGLGESSPSPAFMGESADTIKLAVERYLAPAIIGQEIDALARIHRLMDASIYGQSAAKSAVDIAIHDAWARSIEAPVYSLIGGRYRDAVDLCYVVGIKSDETVTEEIASVIAAGFPAVKLKVGKDPERDLRLVEAAFRTIQAHGPTVRLRLDANQGYSAKTAIGVIRDIEAMGAIDAIEQPVLKADLVGLREIRRHVHTPVMIDETVFSIGDALQAIREGCADAINIKVCKVGGLYPATRIAALAQAAGLACTVGSNLELGIGIAASLHFAASNPAITMPADFICGAYLHTGDFTQPSGRNLVMGGKASPLPIPGLGVLLDPEPTEALIES